MPDQPPSAAELAAATARDPNNPAVWARLGERLLELNKMPAAVAALQRAVALDPSPLNLANLGSALAGADRLDESLASLQRAAELAPHWSEAHRGVGAALFTTGRLDEAIAAFGCALRADPTNAAAHSMLLYALLLQGSTPPARLLAEHRTWAARQARSIARLPPPPNDRSPDRRLKVGYVSPNFRNHAVARFVLPIFENHDPWEVEIFAYSDALATDATTDRLRKNADEWRETATLNDAELAALVRNDRIDLLLDLTGHIGGGRLRAFAAKPAPIQIAYLGYQATTGLAEMDYVLTDAWADPPGKTESFWVEKPWRLPEAFFCYEPPAVAPAVGPPPALAAGHITFGCINNLAKVTPRTLDAWARVLHAAAGSHLLLLTPSSPQVHQRLRSEMLARGVQADRLHFADRAPMRAYLQHYNQIDIALDPIPFNGHTTTADAAWMGVPTVSLAGDCYAHRYGGVVMRSCGLAGLVCEDETAYAAAAVALARDPGQVAEIRASLRNKMIQSPITNGPRFARHLEAAYRAMWRQWCAAG